MKGGEFGFYGCVEGFFLIRLDKVDSDSGGLLKGMCLMQIILHKQKYVT